MDEIDRNVGESWLYTSIDAGSEGTNSSQKECAKGVYDDERWGRERGSANDGTQVGKRKEERLPGCPVCWSGHGRMVASMERAEHGMIVLRRSLRDLIILVQPCQRADRAFGVSFCRRH